MGKSWHICENRGILTCSVFCDGLLAVYHYMVISKDLKRRVKALRNLLSERGISHRLILNRKTVHRIVVGGDSSSKPGVRIDDVLMFHVKCIVSMWKSLHLDEIQCILIERYHKHVSTATLWRYLGVGEFLTMIVMFIIETKDAADGVETSRWYSND